MGRGGLLQDFAQRRDGIRCGPLAGRARTYRRDRGECCSPPRCGLRSVRHTQAPRQRIRVIQRVMRYLGYAPPVLRSAPGALVKQGGLAGAGDALNEKDGAAV